MRKVFIAILLFTCLFTTAQTTKQKQKVLFRSINQIGFLQGQAGSEPLIQSINGLQYKSFSTGIGIGIDYYKERSVPLFLDIRKALLRKSNTPFVYMDGGYHFVWAKEDPSVWVVSDLEGGLYYDLGIGYQFQTFKWGGVTISLGYSSKEMSEVINLHPERSSWPPPPGDFQKMEYKLRRYSFKMGLTL